VETAAMDGGETSDEVMFIPEPVEAIMYDAIESVLKDKMYNDQSVQGWIDEICSQITMELINMKKPFKYMVSCTVMQKNGAGLHTSHSCFWDAGMDNTVVARWPSEKKKDPNARVCCICQVFGVAY